MGSRTADKASTAQGNSRRNQKRGRKKSGRQTSTTWHPDWFDDGPPEEREYVKSIRDQAEASEGKFKEVYGSRCAGDPLQVPNKDDAAGERLQVNVEVPEDPERDPVARQQMIDIIECICGKEDLFGPNGPRRRCGEIMRWANVYNSLSILCDEDIARIWNLMNGEIWRMSPRDRRDFVKSLARSFVEGGRAANLADDVDGVHYDNPGGYVTLTNELSTGGKFSSAKRPKNYIDANANQIERLWYRGKPPTKEEMLFCVIFQVPIPVSECEYPDAYNRVLEILEAILIMITVEKLLVGIYGDVRTMSRAAMQEAGSELGKKYIHCTWVGIGRSKGAPKGKGTFKFDGSDRSVRFQIYAKHRVDDKGHGPFEVSMSYNSNGLGGITASIYGYRRNGNIKHCTPDFTRPVQYLTKEKKWESITETEIQELWPCQYQTL